MNPRGFGDPRVSVFKDTDKRKVKRYTASLLVGKDVKISKATEQVHGPGLGQELVF